MATPIAFLFWRKQFLRLTLLMSAIAFGAIGWLDMERVLHGRGTVHELAILEERATDADQDGWARSNAMALDVVRASAWLIDEVLWPCRDRIERDMDDERALLLSPIGERKEEEYLKLGNLGLELGLLNQAESALRDLCGTAAHLALDEDAQGMSPTSAGKLEDFLGRMEEATDCIKALTAKGRIKESPELSQRLGSMETARAGLVALWQQQEGTRFRRGIRPGRVSLGQESGDSVPEAVLNLIGETLFMDSEL